MEEKLRAQLRNTQQLQQMQSEQAQVNAAKAAAEAHATRRRKLEALRGQLARAQGQAELSQQQSAVLESAQSQIAASNAQLGKFKGAYDELLVWRAPRKASAPSWPARWPSATSRSRAASPRTARCTRPARTS